MANVLIKNIKLPKLPNVRLNIGVKSNFSRTNVYFSRSCRQLRSGRNKFFSRCYSTAASQHALKDDLVIRTQPNRQHVRMNDFNSIDIALENVDGIIKHSGRIWMQDIVDILSMVSAKRMPTSTHGLYLLRCCKYMNDAAPSTRVKLINQVWHKFQDLGVKFDIRHYNALLEVHIYNDVVFDPAEFLTSIEEQALEPNKDTYLLLMKKYCKEGNIGGASEILEFMKEKSLTVNEEVFNSLIHGHLKNKDFTGAEDIVEVMRSLNLNPTEDTYAEFACGYAAEGKKDQMMSYLVSPENKVLMSDRNCLKIIEALAISGNDQYIDDVLHLMKNIYDYQQECINIAIELIHKDCIKTAYKLIIATADSHYNRGTSIFVRQLIKTNKPASQILDYCRDISNKGLNDVIFRNALRSSVDEGNIDCAVLFLKDMMMQGYSVQNYTFFPLFNSLKKNGFSEGVWHILKSMKELGVPASFSTYLDHVYPCLDVPSPKDVIQNVKEAGQFRETATDALFSYYCNLGEIDLAFELIQIVPVCVNSRTDVKSFLNRYQKLKGSAVNKYFQVLKCILENFETISGETEEYQGKFLAELILTHPGLFEEFLQTFEREDLAISEHSLRLCENVLKQNNPRSLGLLRRLKSKISKVKHITVEEEEQEIKCLLAQKNCKQFLIDRIIHHTKLKNIDRVEELVAKYEEMNFRYTPMLLAQLTSVYTSAGNLERAMEFFSKLRMDFPTFTPEIEKTLDLTSVLIKYTKYDDALKILKDGLNEPFMYGNRSNVVKNIRKVIANACDTENVEFVKNVQNLLMPLSKEFGPKKQFLEPIIDVYLHRNDFMSALEEYRKCIINHKTPACLNVFLKKCIASRDKVTLQKVIDVTADHLGKNTALIELAVAFVERDLTQKAATVIQNLGYETNQVILDDICMRLCNQNKLTILENFISITKGLTHIDREKLYYYLFKACAARNDCERAMDNFNRLREEDVELSAKTVECISYLLKQNNQPIPLSLLSSKSSGSDEPSELSTDATKKFLHYVEVGDVELALKEASELKKGFIRTLPLKSLTDILDLCLIKNSHYLHKLSQNVQFMSYLIENPRDVLIPLLKKYSELGDVEKLKSIATVVPDFSLKLANFRRYFCHAFLSSGRHEELLTNLEEQNESSNKLFSVTAFEELLKYPEYENRAVDLAIKYHAVNNVLPVAVVWAHYFIKGKYDIASDLYKKFPFSVERVDNKVLRAIKKDENLSLGQAYVNFVNQEVTKTRVKERAFGTFLDVLVFKQKYDEAVSLVLESEKLGLALHKYYKSTFVTLKNALERENKPVPFRIPSEELSSGSSSSDSD